MLINKNIENKSKEQHKIATFLSSNPMFFCMYLLKKYFDSILFKKVNI